MIYRYRIFDADGSDDAGEAHYAAAEVRANRYSVRLLSGSAFVEVCFLRGSGRAAGTSSLTRLTGASTTHGTIRCTFHTKMGRHGWNRPPPDTGDDPPMSDTSSQEAGKRRWADGDHPGLYLRLVNGRVVPDGIQLKVNGQLRWHPLPSGTSKTDAVKELRRLKHLRDGREVPIARSIRMDTLGRPGI